jgi:hypothetical protein
MIPAAPGLDQFAAPGEIAGFTVTVHLTALVVRISARSRLWPALAGLEAAPGGALDPGQEPIVSQPPADALRGAQARERVAIRIGAEQIGKARDAVADGRAHCNPVVPADEMRPRARPAPVLRAGHQPRVSNDEQCE